MGEVIEVECPEQPRASSKVRSPVKTHGHIILLFLL